MKNKNINEPTHKRKRTPNGSKNKTLVDALSPELVNKKNYSEPKKTSTHRKTQTHSLKQNDVKVYFLGGLNEIGKNITLFECENDMIILDCGMAFPSVDMPGVDLVIPDFSFILKNKSKIRGLVLTHGHEDHIGSIPYLLREINIPIYGTALTIGLLSAKLKEHGLYNTANLNVIKPGQKLKFGCISVEPIHVNHSIPDAVGVAIYTPAGTLVHTGDFKIDCTPAKDTMIDLGKFAELGKKGVLALFADSTNAERHGYTMTERKVSDSFDRLFLQGEKKRIIIASFASNVSRVQQIINCAKKYDRKVAFSGRSMLNYMTIAQELGYLNIPENTLIDIDLLNKYPNEKIVLITTGSQGEPMSALARMATLEHKKVEVGPNDMIIISANPIPGNEKMVGSVVNDLMKRGCQVVYESMYEVHVSGHACQEELKIIQGLVHPKYFIPVHGEQKHLRRHAELAMSMGVKSSNVYIGDIGDGISISNKEIKKLATVPAGYVLVDGLGVGDVGNVVLRDRKHLAEDGIIVVVATLDSDGNVVSGPDIVSRGFVYVRESEELINAARKKVTKLLFQLQHKKVYEWGNIKTAIRDDLSKLFYSKTKRNPMILPILMEV